MTAPEIIHQLVQRFDEHRQSYHSGKYNETQLRREFLDPFFIALGWDVVNRQGYAEAYKDVIHEDSLEIEGENKAPDYAFRVGGVRKFFVEAKKPAVKIETDIHPAFQLRRYAWSAKLPLSILSDFEELAVYDCRAKPDKKDKASVGRVRLYSYKEYIEKWDEIAGIFSREAVLKGSFDAFAEGSKLKKGTAEVDDAFLAEIERWRELLAANIALRNPGLNVREMNYAVQMTIDRIVFLRICEDRGVERDEQLKEIGNPTPTALAGTSPKFDEPQSNLGEAGRGSVYAALCQLFKRADARYNSGLFHFTDEKDASSPTDTLTLNLVIDDKPLQDIIKNLYYPESPYVFREIPSDILGQVYERFLGKVIRLTASHRAKVEEKPEVRKAGGVYYTPTYIVEYIVENTVGKLVGGKLGNGMTPKEVEKLKILDPACGSGTFPLGAYQYLLDWHLKWYTGNDPEKWATGKNPAIYETPSAFGTSPKSADKSNLGKNAGADLGEAGRGWRLTTSKKKEILLNNIYGVDIDPQAVEVTKLSLLLKVLEGESHETIGSQLALFQERVLPDLGKNIKCGNSLIGPDYYEGRQLTMGFADDEERYRVNAFDWKAEFPQVFIAGGFDAVIGNPPYLRIQGLQEHHGGELDYFVSAYKSAVKRYDLYLLFLEKGFSVLNKSGVLGFICPHKFINSDFGSGLRSLLLSHKAIDSIVSFGNNLIFNQASTYTGLFFLKKSPTIGFNYYEFPAKNTEDLKKELISLDDSQFAEYKFDNLTSEPWILTHQNIQVLLDKIRQPSTLEEVCESIFQGVVTGVDDVYFLRRASDTEDKRTISVYSYRLNGNVEVEKDALKPMLKGEDVSRYREPNFENYCIYPYKLVSGKTIILEEKEFSSTYPLAYEYLAGFKSELKELRIKFKTNPTYWYSCHRARSMQLFETPRIITPEISLGCNLTIAPAGLYHNTKVYSVIPHNRQKEHQYYWLGLLNSRIMWWFLSNTGYVLRGGYFVFKTNYLNPFPTRAINFADAADKARHDKMVSLVERMLALHTPTLPSPKHDGNSVVLGGGVRQDGGGRGRTPQEQEMVRREIESTDRAIDRLVYELYGLTEEEIRIVES